MPPYSLLSFGWQILSGWFILIKIHNHIKSSGIFTDFLYDAIFGSDAVPGRKAAGHGYSGVNDITVAAGSLPLNDFDLVAFLYKALAFHFKFYGPQMDFTSFPTSSHTMLI